jgi:hypothetical protein
MKEPTDKELMEEAGGGGGPVLSLAPGRPGLDAMRCGPGRGGGSSCCCSSWSDFLVAELNEGAAEGAALALEGVADAVESREEAEEGGSGDAEAEAET